MASMAFSHGGLETNGYCNAGTRLAGPFLPGRSI